MHVFVRVAAKNFEELTELVSRALQPWTFCFVFLFLLLILLQLFLMLKNIAVDHLRWNLNSSASVQKYFFLRNIWEVRAVMWLKCPGNTTSSPLLN